MKDFIYFIILLIIAAVIGFGLDELFSSVPKNAASFLIEPFTIGIRPISISANVCGIVGLIISFGLIKPFINR